MSRLIDHRFQKLRRRESARVAAAYGAASRADSRDRFVERAKKPVAKVGR